MLLMEKAKILVIDNNRILLMPAPTEIESSFPGSRVKIVKQINDGLSELKNGKYDVAVICADMTIKNQEKLENIIGYLNHKPALILIRNNENRGNEFKTSLTSTGNCISPNYDFKKMIIWSIDAALKKHDLIMEIQKLKDQLCKIKTNQNIIDMTMSYSHEINNLLTMIIGNTQLLIQDGSKEKTSISNKLAKIEKDALKIQRLAMKLTNSIDSTAANPQEKVPA
jgi:K+-sensing histidine kinase KdpD